MDRLIPERGADESLGGLHLEARALDERAQRCLVEQHEVTREVIAAPVATPEPPGVETVRVWSLDEEDAAGSQHPCDEMEQLVRACEVLDDLVQHHGVGELGGRVGRLDGSGDHLETICGKAIEVVAGEIPTDEAPRRGALGAEQSEQRPDSAAEVHDRGTTTDELRDEASLAALDHVSGGADRRGHAAESI